MTIPQRKREMQMHGNMDLLVSLFVKAPIAKEVGWSIPVEREPNTKKIKSGNDEIEAYFQRVQFSYWYNMFLRICSYSFQTINVNIALAK